MGLQFSSSIMIIKSTERLKQVLLYPILSFHIVCPRYEVDRLDHFENREEWESRIVDPKYCGRLDEASREETLRLTVGRPCESIPRVLVGTNESRLEETQGLTQGAAGEETGTSHKDYNGRTMRTLD